MEESSVAEESKDDMPSIEESSVADEPRDSHVPVPPMEKIPLTDKPRDSQVPPMKDTSLTEEAIRESCSDGDNRRRRPVRSLDCACVLRLRYGHLLAFLVKNQYWGAYHELNMHMRLVFNVRELVDLVKKGMWTEAINYVADFASPGESGLGAETLAGFLYRLNVFDCFAHGGHRVSPSFARIIDENDPRLIAKLYPCYFTLARHFVSDRPQAASDMLDWQLVRSKVAKITKAMACQVPEIRGPLRLPRGRAKSNNIFPLVSFSFRRRRHVKTGGWAAASGLVQYYLQKKKSLPSPSPSEVTNHSGSSNVSMERMLALLEEALQAGKRPVLNQQHPTEYLLKQGNLHCLKFT